MYLIRRFRLRILGAFAGGTASRPLCVLPLIPVAPRHPVTPASRSAPSEREDYVTAAYQKLRELIVRGRLAPGTRIIESDVAERLGVSRTPARSALQRLQQEGYVTAMDGGKQVRLLVSPLTEDDAGELFEIVGSVEGLAARGAAGLPAQERKAVVREMERVNEALQAESVNTRPGQNEIFDLDSRFHRLYVEAGAGPRLLALHDAVKPQAERYVRLYISFLVDEIGSSVEEHLTTCRFIDAGDQDGAKRAVEVNWRNAAERLSRVIAVLGERGNW